MPLLTKRSVLAAKIEGTPGTAESLTGADAAMNIFDAEVQVDTEFNERAGQGGMSPLAGTLGAYLGTATFRTELRFGDPVPLELATFLPACGLINTSGVFTPQSLSPDRAGSGTKTATISHYEDGVLKTLAGCMGNAVFTFPSGRVVQIEFTFRGVLVVNGSDQWVTDTALLAPTYPTNTPLRFVNSGLTLGSYSPMFETLTIDLGNDVQPRFDAGGSRAGVRHMFIGTRRITGSLDPETPLAATKDVHKEWLNREEQALEFELEPESSADDDAGKSVAFSIPALQITNPQGGDRNGARTTQIEYQANRDSAAGDDELVITFDDGEA